MDNKTKECFVVGQIGEENSPERRHSDWLLHYVIRPVMEEWPDFKVIRADQISDPGMIDSQIIIRLRNADLVIADLFGLNPNVFYEIGIRHMASNKPIVHMRATGQRIPFDVMSFRSVTYSLDSVQSVDVAKGELRAQINAALDVSHVVDNPVTRALGRNQISSQEAMPELQLVRAEMDSLKTAIQPIIDAYRLAQKREQSYQPIGLGPRNLRSGGLLGDAFPPFNERIFGYNTANQVETETAMSAIEEALSVRENAVSLKSSTDDPKGT